MAQVFQYAKRPFQSDRPLEAAVLADWEQAEGGRLPEDYRHFMLSLNGGSLRPYGFDLVLPDSDFAEPVHALNYWYDWNEVGKRSQWRIEPALRNIPPGRLAIGTTVSELTLTLRLAPEGRGMIEAWVRDTFNVWGEGANTCIVPVAPSFSDFLAMLHDAPGLHHSFWVDLDRRGQVPLSITLP